MRFLQLIFCSSATACDVVRIPIFVFQTCHITVFAINRYLACRNLTIFTVDSYLVASFNGTVFTVNCYITGFNSTFVAVDGNFITSFDCACSTVHRDLFCSIRAQCHLVFETYFIVLGTIRISARCYSNIITCRYRCGCSCCSFIQLRFINCIVRICAVSYIRNLITAII